MKRHDGEHLLSTFRPKDALASSPAKPTQAHSAPDEEDIFASPQGSSDEDQGASDGVGSYAPRMRGQEKPLRAGRTKAGARKGNAGKQDLGVGVSEMDDPFADSAMARKNKNRTTFANRQRTIVADGKGSKRARRGTTGNIHAALRTDSSERATKRQRVGKASSGSPAATTSNTPKKSAKETPKMPQFKHHPLFEGMKSDMPRFRTRAEAAKKDAASAAKEPTKGGSSPLSDPMSSPRLDNLDLELELEASRPTTYPIPARCPICREAVDASFLEHWARGAEHMRVRQQMAFCHAHKQQTAEQEYQANQYPTVDWDGLPARLNAHRAALVRIVRNEQASHFRARLAGTAAAGQGRTLRAADKQGQLDSIGGVGYYGPRGRRVMMDWIAGKVTDEIHEVAGSDPLIGYKTVSGFIQEVLVPELATMLVAEDMDVQEARAREILGESEEIGDLVHQAKEERVEVKEKTVKDDVVDDDNDGDED